MVAEYGHAPNRFYADQNGNIHINGSSFFNSNEVNVAAALENLPMKPAAVTITPAAGTSNVCNVAIQLLDSNGNEIAAVTGLDTYLSDAATGIGLTATSASGTPAAGSAGTDLGILTAKKAWTSITNAAGEYILSITDTAKTGFYVCVRVGGAVFVGPQLVTANYG